MWISKYMSSQDVLSTGKDNIWRTLLGAVTYVGICCYAGLSVQREKPLGSLFNHILDGYSCKCLGIYLMWELFVEYMLQVFGGSHSIALGWAFVLRGSSLKWGMMDILRCLYENMSSQSAALSIMGKTILGELYYKPSLILVYDAILEYEYRSKTWLFGYVHIFWICIS